VSDIPKGDTGMAKTKKQKWVKADKAEVKLRLREKEIELAILIPEEVAKNLARRLRRRFPNA
jgi:hypothetical protein